MRYYPDYDWLRANTDDEAILYYINDKLKGFYADIDKEADKLVSRFSP